MKISETQFFKKLPEVLKGQLTGSTSGTQLIENISPNTINLTIALMERIVEGMTEDPSWTDYGVYFRELNLDKAFPSFEDDYVLSQYELLKSFFGYKGTIKDISYILKSFGYEVIIKDSSYYLNNSIIGIMGRDQYGSSFKRLIELFSETQLLNPIIINYRDFSQLPNSDTYFQLLGITPLVTELTYIDEVILEWFNSKNINRFLYEGYITTTVNVDMDRNNFKGVAMNALENILINLFKSRLSLCIGVSELDIYLLMKDNCLVRVADASTKIELSKTFVDDYRLTNIYIDNGSGVLNATPVPGLECRILESELLIEKYNSTTGLWEVI